MSISAQQREYIDRVAQSAASKGVRKALEIEMSAEEASQVWDSFEEITQAIEVFAYQKTLEFAKKTK